MSNTETFGDFRVEFLHDEKGEKLWSNSLFFNLYDFWRLRRDGFLLKTYKAKNLLLKKVNHKKVKGNKKLPTYRVLLRKFIVGEEQLNPTNYLNSDHQQYFHILKERKKICEEDFLEEYPFLKEPKRHKKIYINI